jgi:hypothetical protein
MYTWAGTITVARMRKKAALFPGKLCFEKTNPAREEEKRMLIVEIVERTILLIKNI